MLLQVKTASHMPHTFCGRLSLIKETNMVFILGLSKYCTMATLEQTKEIFRRADAVCFDVDSTVIREEGIDELAKFCGVGDAVQEMYAREDKCPSHDSLPLLSQVLHVSISHSFAKACKSALQTNLFSTP